MKVPISNHTPPSIHRNITLLAGFNFLCDFRLYAPLAILYFSKVTGSFAAGMSIFSATMLAQALFEVPTGMYSDMIGRKRTIIMGAIISTAAVISYAIGGSYSWLLIGAIFEGLARSFYSGNNDALLMDTLKQEHQEHMYAHYSGKLSTAFQIALGVAGLLGGVIAALSSLRTVLWISVIPQFFTIVLAYLIIEPQRITPHQTNVYLHFTSAFKTFLKKPKLRQISLINSIGYAVGESGYQFRSAFIALFWPLWAIGLVTSLANIGAAISFYFSGKIIKKFKELPILVFAGIYNRTITLIALLFPSWFSPLLMSSSSLLYGVETVSENALLQKEYSDQERATMGSITSLLGSILFAIAAVLLGLGADKLGAVNALIVLQIPMALVVIMTWRLLVANKAVKPL